jgi:hypothetical protein
MIAATATAMMQEVEEAAAEETEEKTATGYIVNLLQATGSELPLMSIENLPLMSIKH